MRIECKPWNWPKIVLQKGQSKASKMVRKGLKKYAWIEAKNWPKIKLTFFDVEWGAVCKPGIIGCRLIEKGRVHGK